MNYYISDLHFGHLNVLMFDNRPWQSLKDMEDCIVSNWNSVVTENDDVYILGDVAMTIKFSEIKTILQRLNGRLHLIRGNHDRFNCLIPNKLVEIVDYKEIEDNGRQVQLCHYPMPCYKSSYRKNTFMLYGHVHATKEWDDMLNMYSMMKIESRKSDTYSNANFYNVGCMMPWMNYTPKTLDQIIEGFVDWYKIYCI